MSRVIIVLVVMALSCLLPSTSALGDDPLTASPLVQEVVISGVEPVPSGVLKMLKYGGAAGGGGGDMIPLPDGFFWRFKPADVMPFRSEGAKTVVCGFAATPTAKITLPSQQTVTAKAVERLSADNWGYIVSTNKRDPRRVMCWSYELPAGYGIELGMYAITVTGKEGELSATWKAEYPSNRGVFTGEFSEGAYFLGYAPNATFQVLYYKRLKTTKRAGSFVAARTVTADEHGVAVVKTNIQRSAPFKADDLFMLIEEPFTGFYQVLDDPLPNTQIGELSMASAPIRIDNLDQYRSIWQGLKFKDSKQPETVEYRQQVKSDDEIRFPFSWCADTEALLNAGKDTLAVSFFIGGNVLPIEAVLNYQEGACQNWVTILRAWDRNSQVVLELHYTLSQPFFDGKSTYSAGTYIHRIVVSVS
jgi:hypothetical protein